MSKKDLYGNEDIEKLYNDYNEEAKIDDYNNYIYEREFREKVIQFLYADNVKLLRTTTEGNILVRLMDINLTPEQTLGRMIYSFSATAYEVDDYTLENIKKYNINGGSLKEQDYDEKDLTEKFTKLGQVKDTIPANKDFVKELLIKKYESLKKDGFILSVDHLEHMRLEFNSLPYLIHENENKKLEPLKDGQEPDETTILGYIVYINNIAIYVSPDGIYELTEGSEINSLSFPVDTNVTIDYIVVMYNTEDHFHKTDITYFYNKVGQMWGIFNYKDSIFRKIWNKYYGEYKKSSQKLVSINGLHIEAEPGTICWIKDSASPNLKQLVINDTGNLYLYDDDAVIEGFYFGGAHVEPANEEDKKRITLPINKYIDTKITVESLDEIKHPIRNGVYTVNKNVNSIKNIQIDRPLVADDLYAVTLNNLINDSKQYIYFNDKWCIFIKDQNEVLCDTEGLVDYYCEIMEGVHLS